MSSLLINSFLYRTIYMEMTNQVKYRWPLLFQHFAYQTTIYELHFVIQFETRPKQLTTTQYRRMVRVCKKGSNLWTTDSKCARVWYVLHCTSYIFTARTSSQLRSYTDFHVSYSNRIIASNISFERYDDFNANYHKWYLRYMFRDLRFE